MSDRPSNPVAANVREIAEAVWNDSRVRMDHAFMLQVADEIDLLTKREAELVSALTVAVRRLAAVRNAILDRQPPAVWDSEIEQARAALKEQP